MSYIVNGDDAWDIDFAPKNVVEEVVQNVRTIITTIKYSIPMDREFGIDGSVRLYPFYYINYESWYLFKARIIQNYQKQRIWHIR